MADRNSRNDTHGQSGKVLIALLVAVVALAALAAGIGGGYYYFMAHSISEAEAATDTPPPKPIFVPVKPMTVNLASNAQVLYIGLSLSVPDQDAADLLTAHMPEVRNRVLLALSDQKAADLTGSADKRRIAQKLGATLSAPYTSDDKPLEINKVLFTNFIVQ